MIVPAINDRPSGSGFTPFFVGERFSDGGRNGFSKHIAKKIGEDFLAPAKDFYNRSPAFGLHGEEFSRREVFRRKSAKIPRNINRKAFQGKGLRQMGMGWRL